MFQLRGDSEQSSIEALKLATDVFIATLAPVQFQEVAGSRQGLADSGKAGADFAKSELAHFDTVIWPTLMV